jgi:hypothetical protein
MANGAPGYTQNVGSWQLYKNSNSVGVGWIQDGIFDTGGDIQLTKSWSLNAAYQHIWEPAGSWGGKWRTSVYGGYVNVSYNDKAKRIILSHLPHGTVLRSDCGLGLAAGHDHRRQRQQLQPGLQLLSGWYPHPVQPGSSDGYRS